MQFSLLQSMEILERTPVVIDSLLGNLSDSWVKGNEGGESWSPYDIVGHLIHGEKTDWMVRAEIILSKRDKHFELFDRFAQFQDSKGKNLQQLLDEFHELRRNNLQKLKTMSVSNDDLTKTGIHPAFGEVTLSQLLATWVVHDLNHIHQISRVMAKQYASAVGPWIEYLGVLKM